MTSTGEGSGGTRRSSGMPRVRRAEDLRSHSWFGVNNLRAFGHRSRIRQLGIGAEEIDGKPVIGIVNTWSEINPCQIHMRERAQEVKRGVLQAGGYPLELPALSLAEVFSKPSAMLYRNLLAMETEELLRSYPIDGAVLMGGCDKTTPALMMGAASMDIPAIYVPAGPMLRGHWRGTTLGSGSDVWKYWDERRAGTVTDCDLAEIEDGIARSPGHCMTMGTASTMTSATEALGMMLPGAASIPAVDSAHSRMAAASGRRIVDMVWEDLRPSTILDERAYADAATTVLALGGSTNALIHLVAMARRGRVKFSLADFDRLSRSVPVLANIRPTGAYLMEDFYYSGGLRALMYQIRDLLHTDRVTVTGRSLGDGLEGAEVFDADVIRPRDNPVWPEGGLAVLQGNLAPNGAVIKHAAAEPRFHSHTGPAVVFDGYHDLQERINDPALDITPDTVLVLRGAGPRGGPGMPEYGMLPIPDRLLQQGVRDMLRISDARMSGTSYGACVLHVSPEGVLGGPLALLRDGDLVTLDVAGRRLDAAVSAEELDRRRATWTAPAPIYGRGYGSMYLDHITQAEDGCDFDFLAREGVVPEPEAG